VHEIIKISSVLKNDTENKVALRLLLVCTKGYLYPTF